MPASRNKALRQFGEALRCERKERGFSQEGLALEAEVNRSYMGSLERGEENVSLLTLLRISETLKVKPSVLLLRAGL